MRRRSDVHQETPEPAPRGQRAFISHSWKDKALARRIGRRLGHRGVRIWIDEAEMQVGDRLSQRLADEIRASSHLVVVLTADAVASRWVAQEIDVARNADVAIVPLLAEEGLSAPLLDEVMGIEITDPLTFETRMDVVAGALLDAPVPEERDCAAIRRDLAAIGREAPELRGLIDELADRGKLTHAQLDAVSLAEPLRHPAETALIALHECADDQARYVISLVAAKLYRELGVGYAVLERQIELEPAGSSHLHTMFNHLGGKLKRQQDLDGAFRLFQLASPPQDQAFASFVRANFDQFSEAHRDQAVAFVVTPDRGPGGFGIDAAYALFARMPDSASLRHLWFFWVNDYKFGGRADVDGAQDVGVFFSHMNDAARDGLSQFDSVMEHFERSYRSLVRSGQLDRVLEAVQMLTTAADRRYVGRAGLARELSNALGSAEWKSFGHDHLIGPLLDLAMAVSNDETYAPALQRLTQVLDRNERKDT
jgi:hypothetical protein